MILTTCLEPQTHWNTTSGGTTNAHPPGDGPPNGTKLSCVRFIVPQVPRTASYRRPTTAPPALVQRRIPRRKLAEPLPQALIHGHEATRRLEANLQQYAMLKSEQNKNKRER